MNIKTEKEGLCSNVIIDGKLMFNNLRGINKSEKSMIHTCVIGYSAWIKNTPEFCDCQVPLRPCPGGIMVLAPPGTGMAILPPDTTPPGSGQDSILIVQKKLAVTDADGKETGETENCMGVYVLVGENAEFRRLDIVYEDEEYYLSSLNAGSGYVALYDDIIVNGVMSDGD
jgi:hypothetical protein